MLKSQILHAAFINAVWKRTVDRLSALPSFAKLTFRQKKLLVDYVLTGSALSAARFAYNCSTQESLRVMSRSAFQSPRVRECLAEYFPEKAVPYLLDEIKKASEDPDVSMPQVEALKLRALILGLLPSEAGQRVGESEPVEVAK